MIKLLPVFAYTCISIMYSVKVPAQIKANPVFSAAPQQLIMHKNASLLHPDLQHLYETTTGRKLQENRLGTPGNAMSQYMQVSNNQVLIDITVKEDMAGTKKALQQLGVQITGVFGRMISGNISITALPQLDSIHSIQFARPAYRPTQRSGTVTGQAQQKNFISCNGALPLPVISQGDTAQRSDIARKKFNVSGKGIKVGILSDSYNNLGTANTGVLNGELPGPGNPFNFVQPVEVIKDFFGSTGTDEGRAMAEIVHDVAPGAELSFHTAFLGEADFAQGIQDLAANGCKVIVDDIAYFDEPFFQDGIIAQSVDLAKKNGVTYFSAAGNNAGNSYESDYRGSTDEILGVGNGTAHNFSAPGIPARYYQPIYIPSGGSFLASFQWDQPCFSAGGAANLSDLDIYLMDVNGNIVAAGVTNNIVSGDPIEIFGFTNNTSNYSFFLAIVKTHGPDPTHLKYNMYKDAQFYITDPAIPGIFAPSLTGHAKADGAISVAAAFYGNTPAYGIDTPKVEWFSSLGGVANYFDVAGNRITPLVRRKPEITAPDGGNTSFFNPFGNGDIPLDADTFPNFFGTSAAAPHAAGVAALMLEAEKLNRLMPEQIKGILAANTVDMDNIYTDGFDKGVDLNTGTGLIKADGAVSNVKFPALYIKNVSLKATCSVNPAVTRSWKITNPNYFDVEIKWLVLGTSQRGSFPAPPGESIFSTNTRSFGYYQVPNIIIVDWEDNFGFTRLAIENSSKTQCGSSSTRQMEDDSVDNAVEKPMLADVFPNPSTTTFNVYLALADQQPVNLQLFSIDGKKLLEKRVAQSKGIVPIDASLYKPGVYLLQIRQGSFNKTLKLIKK